MRGGAIEAAWPREVATFYLDVGKPSVQPGATRDVEAGRIPLLALRAWMNRSSRGGAYSLIELVLTRLASFF
jgi:hypothetical protein